MFGNVIWIGVEVGDMVMVGQLLIWLEVMKMEYIIVVFVDGVFIYVSVNMG